jgi:hypothetical protein
MIKLNKVLPKSKFITRDKQKCTLLEVELYSDKFKMPVYKVNFVASTGMNFNVYYYQNGTTFESYHNAWDMISILPALDVNTPAIPDFTPSIERNIYKAHVDEPVSKRYKK